MTATNLAAALATFTDVVIREGEFFIVPRGVEHQPVADDEVHVLLFEPAGTVNTGNVRDERTVEPRQL